MDDGPSMRAVKDGPAAHLLKTIQGGAVILIRIRCRDKPLDG